MSEQRKVAISDGQKVFVDTTSTVLGICAGSIICGIALSASVTPGMKAFGKAVAILGSVGLGYAAENIVDRESNEMLEAVVVSINSLKKVGEKLAAAKPQEAEPQQKAEEA